MITMSQFILEEGGQGLTEYALILSVLVVAVIIALMSFGTQVSSLFANASEQIN